MSLVPAAAMLLQYQASPDHSSVLTEMSHGSTVMIKPAVIELQPAPQEIGQLHGTYAAALQVFCLA